ncbi:MAG: type II secretion system protein [Nakamurella sp.]
MTRRNRGATVARRVRWAALRERLRRDEGMTLIELTVGMVLMSIFMAMFTGAVLMMTNAMNTSQAINDAASQVNTAFLQLDKTARSASYISTPGISGGSWYVEMRSMDRNGKDLCTQLRVNPTAQQLQSRSWTVVNAVAATPSAWLPIASGITNGGVASGSATQPFALKSTTGSSALFQQLVVTLVPPPGPGMSSSTAGSSFTVTALNSTLPVPAGAICQLART